MDFLIMLACRGEKTPKKTEHHASRGMHALIVTHGVFREIKGIIPSKFLQLCFILQPQAINHVQSRMEMSCSYSREQLNRGVVILI